MPSRTNRVSPSGLFRRLALSASCCFLTSAAMLHTRESISTNLPTPAPSAGPSAGRCTSRPTSPRTVCTTRGELVFGQYVVHFCASTACSLITALRFDRPVHITVNSLGYLVILQLTGPLGTQLICIGLVCTNPLMSCWPCQSLQMRING